MKKFKKLFSLVLVLSMIITVTACRNDTENTTTTTQQYVDNGVVDTPGYNNVTPAESSENQGVQGTPSEAVSTSQNNIQINPEGTTASQESQATQIPNTTQAETQKPTEATPQITDSVGKYTGTYNSIEQAVYYPADLVNSNRTYPIVAFANGTMVSYTFYETLLKELAKSGFIVVGNSETMAADGSAQISSIDFVISENNNASSVLYGKVNTDKIATAGHSQGGRSAVNAAAKDSRIDCVLSIAGSNYVEEAEKLSTPVLFMAGTKDMIVDADKWIKTAYDAVKGPAVYVNYIGGIHTTCCSTPAPYVHYASLWFDAYLNGNTSRLDNFRYGGELSSDSAWTEFSYKGL